MHKSRLFLLCATTVLVAVGAAQGQASPSEAAPASASAGASPDPAVLVAGQELFATNCAECHSIGKDGPIINGPNLWGVVGKKTGSGPDYPYSDALKNSTHIWSAETLDKWIESPSNFIPDNMMPFIGIKDPKERAALIAFIEKRSAEE